MINKELSDERLEAVWEHCLSDENKAVVSRMISTGEIPTDFERWLKMLLYGVFLDGKISGIEEALEVEQ